MDTVGGRCTDLTQRTERDGKESSSEDQVLSSVKRKEFRGNARERTVSGTVFQRRWNLGEVKEVSERRGR